MRPRQQISITPDGRLSLGASVERRYREGRIRPGDWIAWDDAESLGDDVVDDLRRRMRRYGARWTATDTGYELREHDTPGA